MTWTVIVTEPQRERKLGAALKEAGYEVFVPTYVAWRSKFRRMGQITRVLVQGYVFAQIALHELHDFKADGAIRGLTPLRRQSLALAFQIEGWKDAMEDGLFDEQLPTPPRKAATTKPRRNRKARRVAGQAKRKTMEFHEGLMAILADMERPQQVAA